MEEKRLLSLQSERGRPLGWEGGEEEDRQRVGEGEASLVQLREMLKTEREQKVHAVVGLLVLGNETCPSYSRT